MLEKMDNNQICKMEALCHHIIIAQNSATESAGEKKTDYFSVTNDVSDSTGHRARQRNGLSTNGSSS